MIKHSLIALCFVFSQFLATKSHAFNILDYFFTTETESPNDILADFGSDFIWGLGTAPTHVEDVRV